MSLYPTRRMSGASKTSQISQVKKSLSSFRDAFRNPSVVQKTKIKSVEKPKKSYLGKGDFRGWGELSTEVGKDMYYRNIAGKKTSREDRVKLLKELGTKSGATGGFSIDRLNIAIKKLKKEKEKARYKIGTGELRKTLDRKIKEAESWKKNWETPK